MSWFANPFSSDQSDKWSPFQTRMHKACEAGDANACKHFINAAILSKYWNNKTDSFYSVCQNLGDGDCTFKVLTEKAVQANFYSWTRTQFNKRLASSPFPTNLDKSREELISLLETNCFNETNGSAACPLILNTRIDAAFDVLHYHLLRSDRPIVQVPNIVSRISKVPPTLYKIVDALSVQCFDLEPKTTHESNNAARACLALYDSLKAFEDGLDALVEKAGDQGASISPLLPTEGHRELSFRSFHQGLKHLFTGCIRSALAADPLPVVNKILFLDSKRPNEITPIQTKTDLLELRNDRTHFPFDNVEPIDQNCYQLSRLLLSDRPDVVSLLQHRQPLPKEGFSPFPLDHLGVGRFFPKKLPTLSRSIHFLLEHGSLTDTERTMALQLSSFSSPLNMVSSPVLASDPKASGANPDHVLLSFVTSRLGCLLGDSSACLLAGSLLLAHDDTTNNNNNEIKGTIDEEAKKDLKSNEEEIERQESTNRTLRLIRSAQQLLLARGVSSALEPSVEAAPEPSTLRRLKPTEEKGDLDAKELANLIASNLELHDLKGLRSFFKKECSKKKSVFCGLSEYWDRSEAVLEMPADRTKQLGLWLFYRACDLNSDHCFDLGERLLSFGMSREAFCLFSRCCDGGNSLCCQGAL